MEHFDIVPVVDKAGGPNTVSDAVGREASYQKTGGTYYLASLRIPFSPAYGALILDSYFENTTPGAGPGYIRNYQIEDIPSEPLAWLTVANLASKTGFDENYGGLGGVVNAITFSGGAGGPVVLQTQVAFAQRFENAATGSASYGNIVETGNSSFHVLADYIFLAGLAGAAATRANLNSFSFTLSHAIRADFWANRYPWRISRREWQLTGEFVLREVDSETAEFAGYWRGDSPISIVLLKAESMLFINAMIRNVERFAQDGTFFVRYTLEGVSNPAATYETPLYWVVTPARTY